MQHSIPNFPLHKTADLCLYLLESVRAVQATLICSARSQSARKVAAAKRRSAQAKLADSRGPQNKLWAREESERCHLKYANCVVTSANAKTLMTIHSCGGSWRWRRGDGGVSNKTLCQTIISANGVTQDPQCAVSYCGRHFCSARAAIRVA
jgi:hypothetical protein